jgi:hypothetical protein
MANPFDQFDKSSAPAATSGNPFDQFDSGTTAPNATPERSWSSVPKEALSNIPSSAGNFAKGIYEAVRHPIDTASSLLDVGAGALRNVLPASVSSAIDSIDSNPQAANRASQAASAAGEFIKDRYGSNEALKKTIATDPVGVASDLSAILTGGASLARTGGNAARFAALRSVPGAATTSAVLAGTGDALGSAARLVNPITPVVAAASKAAPVVGNAAAALIGGLGTHTGAESIKQAFKSGQEGGTSAKSFTDNMRGNVPISDVLETAKANLEAIGRAKSDAYKAGIQQVSNDKTILDFTGIDKAVDDALKVVTYKGQVKNAKAADIQRSIAEAVDQWKRLDPAEYHTPEGLDALKQQIGGIADSIPFEEKTANLVGKKVYNAIKNEIVKQAPTYADTMKAYTDASDQLREIEKTLSLGKNASVDTAMRKLQSLTRNNANTNYGNRLALAKQLEEQGGREIMPALAGQALSSPTPRGLGSAVAGLGGIGAYGLGGAAAAIPALAVQSPRLMGEAAYGTGAAARMASGLPAPSVTTLNGLYQAGQLKQRVERQRALQGIGSAQTVDEAITAVSGQ